MPGAQSGLGLGEPSCKCFAGRGGCLPLPERLRPQSQTAQATPGLRCLHPSGCNTPVAREPQLRPAVALIPPRCDGLRSGLCFSAAAARPPPLVSKPSRCLSQGVGSGGQEKPPVLAKHRPGVLRPGQESRKAASSLSALLVGSYCFSVSLSLSVPPPLFLSNSKFSVALAVSVLSSSLVPWPLPAHWSLASHLPPLCLDSSHRSWLFRLLSPRSSQESSGVKCTLPGAHAGAPRAGLPTPPRGHDQCTRL